MVFIQMAYVIVNLFPICCTDMSKCDISKRTHCSTLALSVAGSDFRPSTSTITFGPLDRESCTEVDIINDEVENEVPEVFEVHFMVMQGMEFINPISTVTIIDDDVGECRATTVFQSFFGIVCT